MVLKQIEILHDLGFVHGDLLPRNLTFSDDAGYVIDFDLMRKENELYVSGYNGEIPRYRHSDAKPFNEMKKAHDVWALAQMTMTFFDIGALENCQTVADLLLVVNYTSVQPKPAENLDSGASGSPTR
jgi:serine/threonine protein kinase